MKRKKETNVAVRELTSLEIRVLKASESEGEWDSVCVAIKQARGGVYPPDWFAVVIAGGIMDQFAKKLGLVAKKDALRCNQCGAVREEWQSAADIRCPRHAMPEPYSSCDGILECE